MDENGNRTTRVPHRSTALRNDLGRDQSSPSTCKSKNGYLFKAIGSPAGKLPLVARNSEPTAILWENERPGRVRLGPVQEDRTNDVLCLAEDQLGEYFSGIGHPFGATGVRDLSQTVKELAALPRESKAIVSVCADGGKAPYTQQVPYASVIKWYVSTLARYVEQFKATNLA